MMFCIIVFSVWVFCKADTTLLESVKIMKSSCDVSSMYFRACRTAIASLLKIVKASGSLKSNLCSGVHTAHPVPCLDFEASVNSCL